MVQIHLAKTHFLTEAGHLQTLLATAMYSLKGTVLKRLRQYKLLKIMAEE